MSAIRKEIEKAFKLSQKKGEELSDYLARVQAKVEDADDDTWDALSDEAQNWANKAATAVKAKKAIANFPDAADEGEEEETKKPARGRKQVEEEDEGEEEAAPKRAAKKTPPAKKSAPAKKAPAKKEPKPKKEKAPKKLSAIGFMRRQIAKDPEIDLDKLRAKLEKAGYKMQDSSIRTCISDTRDVLKAIEEARS